MIPIKKIQIKDSHEYELIEDENDFIKLIDTYLGEDARIFLENLIDKCKTDNDIIEEFKRSLTDFIEDY